MTLFKTSTFRATQGIGLVASARFWLNYGSESSELIRKSLWQVLHTYGTQCSFDPEAPRDPKGCPMPKLHNDWQRGNRSSEQMYSIAHQLIESYPDFKDDHHKNMIAHTLAWIFTPKAYSASWVIIPEALALLEECASQRDKEGNIMHRFFILSNFARDTYELLSTRPENAIVFKHFPHNHRYVSAFHNDLKPHLSFYQKLLTENQIDLSDAIFIDDQEENCVAARKLGIAAVHVQNNDFVQVRKELASLGALSH